MCKWGVFKSVLFPLPPSSSQFVMLCTLLSLYCLFCFGKCIVCLIFGQFCSHLDLEIDMIWKTCYVILVNWIAINVVIVSGDL